MVLLLQNKVYYINNGFSFIRFISKGGEGMINKCKHKWFAYKTSMSNPMVEVSRVSNNKKEIIRSSDAVQIVTKVYCIKCLKIKALKEFNKKIEEVKK